MDPADTKELPREMSAADVAEETKADVEAVKSVEDASYPTTASRELSHTKPSFAADADRSSFSGTGRTWTGTGKAPDP